jgi:hypothetical protein
LGLYLTMDKFNNNGEQTVKKEKRKMELFKRVPGAGHSQHVLDILSRAHHVELAKDWDGSNVKALRRELSAMKTNLDAVMCFVKAYENSEDEEIPICVGDIRARAMVLLGESGKLLRSFRIPENILKEKIAWLSFEYKQLKIDVEGLCLMAEGEPSAEAVEMAL